MIQWSNSPPKISLNTGVSWRDSDDQTCRCSSPETVKVGCEAAWMVDRNIIRRDMSSVIRGLEAISSNSGGVFIHCLCRRYQVFYKRRPVFILRSQDAPVLFFPSEGIVINSVRWTEWLLFWLWHMFDDCFCFYPDFTEAFHWRFSCFFNY